MTFNFLIDLITQVPDTRQMYLRRLRTLTDYYYPTGRLAGVSHTSGNKPSLTSMMLVSPQQFAALSRGVIVQA